MDNDAFQCNHFVMTFRKYHGTGNDFLVVDARQGRPAGLTPEAVKGICNRHFGVGGDGILLVEKGLRAPWFMRVLNSDGSEAEMCGNGIRCVAKFIAEHLQPDRTDDFISIETSAGVKECTLSRNVQGNVESVSVLMGPPSFDTVKIPMLVNLPNSTVTVTVDDREFTGTGVSMGNPHFVIFDYLSGRDAEYFGSQIAADSIFPDGSNIEFAKKVGPDHFRLTVYERGCGLTLACGTGASGTIAAAVKNGLAGAGQKVRIDLPGGPLQITVHKDMTDVTLQGPAVEVFRGNIDLGDFA